MWVIFAFPPLVVSFSSVPAQCPKCGAKRDIRIHELPKRVDRFGEWEEPFSLRSVKGSARVIRSFRGSVRRVVRYKCQVCKSTFIVNDPALGKISRLPALSEAYLTTLYCLGYPPKYLIGSHFEGHFSVSRATLYRILNTVEDDELKNIHRHNRVAKKKVRNFVELSRMKTVMSDEFFVDNGCGIPPDYASNPIWPESNIILEKVQYMVGVVRLLKEAISPLTIGWLDGYLRGYDHAGLLVYDNRVELEQDFRAGLHSGGRLVVSRSMLEAPLRKDSPALQNGVLQLIEGGALNEMNYDEQEFERLKRQLLRH